MYRKPPEIRESQTGEETWESIFFDLDESMILRTVCRLRLGQAGKTGAEVIPFVRETAATGRDSNLTMEWKVSDSESASTILGELVTTLADHTEGLAATMAAVADWAFRSVPTDRIAAVTQTARDLAHGLQEERDLLLLRCELDAFTGFPEGLE